MSRAESPETGAGDAEIAAAVVTVLAARAIPQTATDDDLVPEGVWADPAHRPGIPSGPGELGWWASGLPR